MKADQGIYFRRPLTSSSMIEKLMQDYREAVPFVEEDVVMEDYIAKTMHFLENYDIVIE